LNLVDQVREEIRLMAELKDRQHQFGDVSEPVLEPLEKLADHFDATGNYERRRDVLVHLVQLKEVSGIRAVLPAYFLPELQSIFGEEHMEVSASLTELGRTFLLLGDDPHANEFLERALRIDEKEFGFDDPHLAKTLVLLGS
jgi:hypothetical protein